MKKSLIWTAAGIAAVGFGVPAFAAQGDSHRPATPASVSVAVTTATVADDKGVDAVTISTPNSVEDVRGNCDEAEHANDAACTGVTASSVSDDATENSVEDATENSVEDVSGNCDEAEHANDAACTGQATTVSVDDNSRAGGVEDNSGHGSDDSGRGTDDSGRHSNDG